MASLHHSFDPACRVVAITLGDSKSCTIWKHRHEGTWNEVVEKLSKSPKGEKDGPGYTPALLTGHTRQLPFVTQIDIAVLDSDAGHTLAEIAASVQQSGFEAVVHSTHSHLTDTAEVSISSLEKHQGDAEALMREKGFLPRVVAGCQKVGETHDGKIAIIKHQPCPRFRIVFPLLEPWRAAEYASKAEADEAWRSFIRGLSKQLGLQTDQAC